MNHRERVHAALKSQPVDRVPVALWRHFPNDDLRAETLAARVVEFQKKFDFDFVKVTPASGYPAEMYGAAFRDGKNREGTRVYVARPVNALGDWDKLVPLDAKNPVFARETAALKLIRQQLGGDGAASQGDARLTADSHVPRDAAPDVPILQTIFSPLNSAHNLAGERLFDDLRAQPEVLHRALKALTETTARFAVESLRAGADAIFFATQMATRKYLSEDEFRKFGAAYDLQVLDAIRAAKSDFVFLHIHGIDIYFDLLAQWPVDVLNWHDRRTAPSLKGAREISRAGGSAVESKRALSGGINEWDTLAAKSRDAVSAEVRDALAQTGGRGFIVAAGCVIPVDTPEENIRAVIEAVHAA
ncbi:MAG: uroporphyrinogen decarboxylase [Chloroflexota bacterium]|nr:uroporphyrinogen decarboxylase [Chloroflexota bacterium]